MANQYTKKAAAVDEAFAHALPGPTNEELEAKRLELEELRARSGYPKVEVVSDAADKRRAAQSQGITVEGARPTKEIPSNIDKQFEGWGDLEFDPLGDLDPLAGLKRKYERPGMSLKLMSPGITAHAGSKGYRVVKDADGNPVTCGKMILGEMPSKFAEMRRKAGIANANERIRGINDGRKADIEKLRMQAGEMGVQIVEPGEISHNNTTGRDQAAGITVERVEAR